MAIWVYGDVTIDNYEYECPEDPTKQITKALCLNDDPIPDLSTRLRHRFAARQFGGAHLLARNIAVALAVWSDKAATNALESIEPWKSHLVEARQQRDDLIKDPDEFHGYLNLFYRIAQQSDKSYRVSPGGREGYTLPLKRRKGQPFFHGILEENRIVLAGEQDGVDVCVFNDGGTRLCRCAPEWLERQPWAASDRRGKSWAVFKTHEVGGTYQRSFLEAINGLFGDRAFFVVSADDLRRSGIRVTRSLSWERSTEDIRRWITAGRSHGDWVLPKRVIVTFGYDAALSVHPDESEVYSTLVYSTNGGEGDFQSRFEGTMPGSQTAFCSVLSAMIYNGLQNGISLDTGQEWMLTYALAAMQRTLRGGFNPIRKENMFSKVNGETATWLISNLYNHEAIFAVPAHTATPVLDESPPSPRLPSAPSEHTFANPWGRSLGEVREDQNELGLSSVSFPRRSSSILAVLLDALPRTAKPFVEYVQTGSVSINDTRVSLPICSIGKVKTISSREIDALRSIRRLLNSYLSSDAVGHKPLAIAVFGPPGTGKSFTVKSIFETLQGRAADLIKESFIECNLSGLSSASDLATFFHRARDKRLIGKVPVIFFDEFDCTIADRPLYWLQFFLSPIQDGQFTANNESHPIGKAIFVFAGGIAPSFTEFASLASGTSGSKGTDFLSRLQGHIDVEGIMPNAPELRDSPAAAYFENDDLRVFALRRAILLRELLMLHAADSISHAGRVKRAEISEAVVRAFLSEPNFRHGVRSLEAIIRMSSVAGHPHFNSEQLPTAEQLSMHVSKRFHETTFA